MSIYTAPSNSFIDTFMNAAKYRDQRTADENRQMMEGVGNIVKGGTNAYLWQKRKNALDGLDSLEAEKAKLLSELDMLTGDQNRVGSTANFNAIMNGLDFNLMDSGMKRGMGGLY